MLSESLTKTKLTDPLLLDLLQNIRKGVKGLKVGIPKEYIIDGMSDEIKKLLDHGRTWLKDMGANPVKLGLDLSGGVHFLLEVDIDTAQQGRLELLLDTYRKSFAEDRIKFNESYIEDLVLFFEFSDKDSYNKWITVLVDKSKSESRSHGFHHIGGYDEEIKAEES